MRSIDHSPTRSAAAQKRAPVLPAAAPLALAVVALAVRALTDSWAPAGAARRPASATAMATPRPAWRMWPTGLHGECQGVARAPSAAHIHEITSLRHEAAAPARPHGARDLTNPVTSYRIRGLAQLRILSSMSVSTG